MRLPLFSRWRGGDRRRSDAVSLAQLMGRLAEDIASQTAGAVVALCVVSLARSDQMEAVLGHADCQNVDDRIRERVLATLRPDDYFTLASPGELWVVLPALPSAVVAGLAASSLVAALEPPITNNQQVVTLRPLVGVAFSAPPVTTPLQMLKAAANARTHAGAIGQRYAVEVMHGGGALVSADIAAHLQRALAEDGLAVHYQPKVDLISGRVAGVEALVRWSGSQHPEVTPGMLIDAAEQFGLIPELTRFVLNTALREYSTSLVHAGIDKVWVNLSVSTVRDPRLPTLLRQMVDVWSVGPDALGLELTESLLLSDVDQSVANLDALVDHGFALSIDDFGTGYSSLAYLRRLPLHELKIDQLFIRNMALSLSDQQIVRTIIDLAHNFQLTVVAEGVENDATLALLRSMGCNQVQGYIFTKALPGDQIVAWMQNRAGAHGNGAHPLLRTGID